MLRAVRLDADHVQAPRQRRWVAGLLCAIVIAACCLAACCVPTSTVVAGPLLDGDPDGSGQQPANADTLDPLVPIVEVLIEGNVTIPPEAIASKIRTRAGRPADDKTIREDVRSLYATRWFKDVQPFLEETSEGPVVIFKVVELPITQTVKYIGNKNIKTRDLAEITGLKPGSPFSPSHHLEMCRRIETRYQEKGYLFAKCELQRGGSIEDRDVIFEITEGPYVFVYTTSFKGNKEISSAILRQKLKTSRRFFGIPYLWNGKFGIGGKYDPALAAEDEAGIREYYLSLGYFDIDVRNEQRFLSEDRASVELVYHVTEGPRYRVRDILVTGNDVISEEAIREGMTLKPGDYFNERFLRKDVEKIQNQYGELGRIFAGVEPQPRHHGDELPGIIDLEYRISEDKPYRIRRINVHVAGDNPHTRSTVVLNKMLLRPGDLANQALIKRSEQRVMGSQVFAGAQPGAPGAPRITVRRGEDLDVPRTAGGNVIRAQQQEQVKPQRESSRNALPAQRAASATASGSRAPASSFDSRATRSAAPVSRSVAPVSSGASTAPPGEQPRNGLRKNRHSANRIHLQNLERERNQAAVPGALRRESVSSIKVKSDLLRVHELPHLAGSKPIPALNWLPKFAVADNIFRAEQQAIVRAQSPGLDNEPRAVFRAQGAPPPGSLVPPPAFGGTGPLLDPVGRPFQSTPGPGFVDLDVNVQETQTGRVSIGVGVNSNAGVLGSAVLEENNFDLFRLPTSWQDVLDGTAFRGAGQQFRLEAQPGTVFSRYLASWSDPNFLNTDYFFRVSGQYYQRFFQNWNEQRLGGRIALGRQLTPEWSTTASVRLEQVRIFNPTIPTPADVTSVLGNNFLSTGRISIAHDTRDFPFMAGRGHYIEASFEQGISDFSYPRVDLDARQFFTVWERPDGGNRHIISLTGQVGYTGPDTPFFERYFLGGYQSFRGFSFYGVTPRENGFRVGGNFQAVGSVEYMLPVTASDSLQLVAFSDFGTINPKASLDDFRVTVGGGLRILIPAMGPVPIALDWGVPIVKNAQDDVQMFQFYISASR